MKLLNNFLISVKQNLQKHTLAILSAYFATLLLILDIYKAIPNTPYNKITATLVLGYFLFLVADYFKTKTVYVATIATLLLHYFYYGSKLDILYYTKSVIYLIIASIITMFWAKFFNKYATNLEIFIQSRRVLIFLGISFLLSLFIMLGFFVAYEALNKLLSLHIGGKVFGVTAMLSFGVFGANYFLYLLDNVDLNYQNDQIEKLLAKYILPIFTAGYFLIIYAYSAKILFTGVWPKGIVAWFVLVFTLVATTSYFLLTPYKNSKIKRLFILAIPLQAIMLLIAVDKRVDAYSLTENRYMLIVYGIFLLFASLYLLSKRVNYKYLFIAITLVLIATQIPFIGANSVAKLAQEARLTTLLKDKNANSRDIKSTIEYLASRYGINGLSKPLPKLVKKFKEESKESSKYTITNWFYKELKLKDASEDNYLYLDRKNNQYLNVKGYDYITTKLYGYKKVIKDINTTINFNKKDKTLRLKSPKVDITINMQEYFKKIKKENTLRPFSYSNRDIKVKFIIEHITLKGDRVISIRYTILLKLNPT